MTILKMNPDEYSISAEYIPLLAALVERRGITQAMLLEGVDVDPEMLRLPAARISKDAFCHIVTRALELTGEPALGWEMGASMTFSSHGFLGYAAMSSETLQDAIDLAVKFHRTRSTLANLYSFVDGDTAGLELEELVSLGEVKQFLTESMFSSFYFIFAKLISPETIEGEARFSYPQPAYFERVKPIIPVPCYFDCASSQLRFPARLLDEQLRFADPRLASMALAQCEQEMASIKAPPALLGKVRRIILARSGRFPDVDEVAGELHMSSRTLKRKLQQLGTNYQRILDDLRKGLAVEYLSQTTKTVDDIAILLGYSDASNFARAFRRWTGKSPSDYRV